MEMLELVENHYLKLGLEIVPTLPALVPSVLLMIEENDEAIRLKTLSVIDNLVGVRLSYLDRG
jgi:Dopey, N-terminal